MKKKLAICVLALCLIVMCIMAFTACTPGKEEIDATLYQLTLSSNITLSEEQKTQLKATYGYGEPSATVKQGVRDAEEIEELKKAGATDADINKAGVRQQDGSYFFFEADPIYLEAPMITGYKLLGFYNKADGRLELNPILQDIDGGKYLPRYNMDNKNVELEARYQKWTYSIGFNNMEEGDVNPNTRRSYCFIDEGVITLAPATTTNKFKTFIRWEYQNGSEWIALENSTLPPDYYEDSMRIGAVWEIEYFTIDFDFEYQIDAETKQPLTFEQACEKILVHGNLSTVDGEPVYCDTQEPKTEVKKNSVLKMQYGSWLEIFITPNEQYNISQYVINDGTSQTYYEYISLNKGNITNDSTIKIVLTSKK